MNDRRKKDVAWIVADANGKMPSWEHVQVAVLMDIRDELKAQNVQLRKLNDLLYCPNFTRIPRTLSKISSNTANLPKKAKP